MSELGVGVENLIKVNHLFLCSKLGFSLPFGEAFIFHLYRFLLLNSCFSKSRTRNLTNLDLHKM